MIDGYLSHRYLCEMSRKYTKVILDKAKFLIDRMKVILKKKTEVGIYTKRFRS